MDVTFDPAKVRWSFEPGPGLILHYGDDLPRSRSAISAGARSKFPLREEGVMLKAVVLDTRWMGRGRDQCFGDWVIWEAAPADLRPHLQPTLCHAWQRLGETRLVSWSAQEWCDGSDDVTFLESDLVYEMVIRTGVLQPVDEAPCQHRRRPDGSIVTLDYGSWFLADEDTGNW